MQITQIAVPATATKPAATLEIHYDAPWGWYYVYFTDGCTTLANGDTQRRYRSERMALACARREASVYAKA